jgi:hypothetical protein
MTTTVLTSSTTKKASAATLCVTAHAVSPPEPLAVLAARLAATLEASVTRFLNAADQNLGHLETQAIHDVQALLRQTTQRAAQAKADATPPRCPVCGQPLSRCSAGHARTFQTRFGDVTIHRTRGYCKRCRKWRIPADTVLGLDDTAGYSPAVQALAALAASKLPIADATVVLEHLSGVKLPPATLDREAKRQGQRAQRLRTQLDEQAPTDPRQPELTLEPYQLLLQLDAWSLRERDAWGQSAALRRQGTEPERWRWVYTGTVFRLDHRGQTAGGRPVISERGYVLTRQGLDALRTQMHGEALRRGLGQAASVLVIGDGAVWIWRLADDRWPQARQRLDFYHAVQHLAAVGRALWGEDQEKCKAWLKPLVRQLKHESAVKVVRKLDEVLAGLSAGPSAEVVAKEIAYMKAHQKRMDYRAGRRAGEPIGSGPVEATCRQAQCRFKRPGQFWSTVGDEALLCLETFWRNHRWSLLFPHTAFDPATN